MKVTQSTRILTQPLRQWLIKLVPILVCSMVSILIFSTSDVNAVLGRATWAKSLKIDSPRTSSSHFFTTKSIVDTQNRNYLVGQSNGPINFGNSAALSTAANLLITQFSPTGTAQWARGFTPSSGNGCTFAEALDVALDVNENLLVSGTFCGVIDFGGGFIFESEKNGSNQHVDDAFVLRISSTGVTLWAKQFHIAAKFYPTGIAADKADNILLAGSCQLGVHFDSLPMFSGLSGLTSCLVKLSPTGQALWSVPIGSGSTSVNTLDVQIDSSGKILVGGSFRSADLRLSDQVVATWQSGDGDQGFLAKFSSTGSAIWATKAGGATGSDWIESISVDAHDSIAVMAVQNGDQVSVGETQQISIGQSSKAVLFKFDSAGNLDWFKALGNTSTVGNLITTNGTDFIVATAFSNAFTLSGTTLTSQGYSDIAVASFASNGNTNWQIGFGGTKNEAPKGISANAIGALTLSGTFQSLTLTVPGSPQLSGTEEELYLTSGFISQWEIETLPTTTTSTTSTSTSTTVPAPTSTQEMNQSSNSISSSTSTTPTTLQSGNAKTPSLNLRIRKNSTIQLLNILTRANIKQIKGSALTVSVVNADKKICNGLNSLIIKKTGTCRIAITQKTKTGKTSRVLINLKLIAS